MRREPKGLVKLMANPSQPAIVIDPKVGVPPYPYPVTLGYSPPHKWDGELVKWMDPDGDDNLSAYLPKSWANTDITKVPALVPPPPISSDCEIADLFALKEQRPRYLDRIIAEDQVAFDVPFCKAMGDAGVQLDVALPNLPSRTVRQHILALRRRVHFDSGCIVLNQKALFNRLRPWQVAPGLHPFQLPPDPANPASPRLPPHPAYPSGHSTCAHAFAWIMEEALRETDYFWVAERFTDHAMGMARRREIAGYHYSSDTVAGMLLAKRIVEEYLKPGSDFRWTWLAPLRQLPT